MLGLWRGRFEGGGGSLGWPDDGACRCMLQVGEAPSVSRTPGGQARGFRPMRLRGGRAMHGRNGGGVGYRVAAQSIAAILRRIENHRARKLSHLVPVDTLGRQHRQRQNPQKHPDPPRGGLSMT
ncbi:hypothetical protein FGB62_54g03 [Gracilaria domingensis]|nr:hypothetical protein FGB62_54g03 [Gracilaria domingensis]